MRQKELERLLSQIRSLLERYQVKFWAAHFAELERRFKMVYRSGNDRAKREILEQLDDLYGGMGSFNDLTISSLNDAVSAEDEILATDNLNRLRRQLYRMLQEEKASLK